MKVSKKKRNGKKITNKNKKNLKLKGGEGDKLINFFFTGMTFKNCKSDGKKHIIKDTIQYSQLINKNPITYTKPYKLIDTRPYFNDEDKYIKIVSLKYFINNFNECLEKYEKNKKLGYPSDDIFKNVNKDIDLENTIKKMNVDKIDILCNFLNLFNDDEWRPYYLCGRYFFTFLSNKQLYQLSDLYGYVFTNENLTKMKIEWEELISLTDSIDIDKISQELKKIINFINHTSCYKVHFKSTFITK